MSRRCPGTASQVSGCPCACLLTSRGFWRGCAAVCGGRGRVTEKVAGVKSSDDSHSHVAQEIGGGAREGGCVQRRSAAWQRVLRASRQREVPAEGGAGGGVWAKATARKQVTPPPPPGSPAPRRARLWLHRDTRGGCSCPVVATAAAGFDGNLAFLQKPERCPVPLWACTRLRHREMSAAI